MKKDCAEIVVEHFGAFLEWFGTLIRVNDAYRVHYILSFKWPHRKNRTRQGLWFFYRAQSLDPVVRKSLPKYCRIDRTYCGETPLLYKCQRITDLLVSDQVVIFNWTAPHELGIKNFLCIDWNSLRLCFLQYLTRIWKHRLRIFKDF